MTSILPAIFARLRVALAPPVRSYRAFVIDGETVGWIDTERASELTAFGRTFEIGRETVTLNARLRSVDERTAALESVARDLALRGLLSAWRNERYAIARAFGTAPLCTIERAAARYFGLRTYAAHVNGYAAGDGGTVLWFARRSPGKAIDPGQLDNLVGGGIAADGTSAFHSDPIRGTLIKEAWEEAGIDVQLASKARLTTTVNVRRELPDGLQRETIFVHELELPPGFAPRNQDGEAVEHRLVALEEAARLIALDAGSDIVTVDASLVVLHFLLAHGWVAADAPEHPRLAALLDLPLAP